jgi:hypothetical protein
MRIAISTHNQRAAEKTRGEKRGNDASKQQAVSQALAFPLLAQWSGGRTHFARNNYYCFGEWASCERTSDDI